MSTHAVIFSEHKQGTPEWLAARAGLETSSRADCVAAKARSGAGEATTRRDYRFQLAAERLTGKPLESHFVSRHMRDGIENEPYALMKYEERSGVLVKRVGFARLPTILAGASLDGLVDDDGFTEVKCPKPATHFEYWERKRLPPDYVPQVVHQFWISGKEWCDFISYCPLMPEKLQLVVVRVHREELKKEIDAHIAASMQFLAETSVLEQQFRRAAA